jgi:hypothetical protein
MGNPARMCERQQMTLDELITAVERLQAVYNSISDTEQHESKQYIRWAIKHLTDKLYMASL